jgi:hypothetical protein
MFRNRLTAQVALAGLLAVLAPTSGVIASMKAGAATGTHLLTCTRQLVTRPGNYLLSCADANARLTRVQWSSWGATRATGAGTLSQNSCTPNCASGHFINYAVTISLGKVITSSKYGKEFSRAVFHYKVKGKPTEEIFYLND